MAVIGLVTNEGLSKVVQAADNSGYFIFPKEFAVSDTAGTWSIERTEAQSPASWYRAAISGFTHVGAGAIEFVCTIPPGASPINRQIREIQIICEDSDGNQFLFGFGQPGDPPRSVTPLQYLSSDLLSIRMQMIISPYNVDNVFNFIWSQAQEIEEHNMNPNSHPEILKLLNQHGIYMFQSEYTPAGIWIDPWPSFDTATVTDKMWVYKSEDDQKYYPAIADGSNRSAVPGLLDMSPERGPRVIYGGLVSYDVDIESGGTLYLSNSEEGKATSARTQRPLGISIGNKEFLISSGVGTGSGDQHLAIQSDYLASTGEFLHVWFPDATEHITVTLPDSPALGDTVRVFDVGQAVSLNGKTIIIDGNGKGIDDAVTGDSDTYIIDVPGGLVAFIFNPENESWAIDLGGRVNPYANQNINIYYWTLTADGTASLSFKQNSSNPDVPLDTNPYHFLVQVNDSVLIPSEYTINPTDQTISFTTPPASGDSVVIRYVGAGATIDGCPIGMLGEFPKGVVPPGWAICNGQTYDTERYPALFALLGTNTLPEITTSPESFIAWWIKAYDSQLSTGYMNSILNVPVGFEAWWNATTPPVGWLDMSAENGLLSRAIYPSLWKHANESGNIIDDATWLSEVTTNGSCGKFSSGDGGTTFRVPLIKDVYIRANGTNALGDYQGDAIRNITGSFVSRAADEITEGAFSAAPYTDEIYLGTTSGGRKTFSFDASLQVPTADENRPVTIVRTPIIKAFDTAINASAIDFKEVLDALANKADNPIGGFGFFDETAPPNGWRVASGSLIANASAAAPKLYAYLQTSEGEKRVVTEEEWQAQSQTAPWNGVGGVTKFVLDTTANTIRLPDIRGMHSSSSGYSGQVVGDVLDDAIRNVTGYFGLTGDGWLVTATGVFSGRQTTTNANANGTTTTRWQYTGVELNTSNTMPTADENRPRTLVRLGCVFVGS